ncbi:MAG: ABC-type multidrug transport system, ATPase component CcmA [Candidatus Methanohalarchaeum thermophilum]|uniref:ABC-type multidrug transport system, ATPase component CcmA n=1 Tax=Methanohalarchaeum thermophilum TaxID=1903181 RepID=A0A1Q6DSB6_METT1|nr:MAG: ABC-type multidrug transport system, ATPase component CcmA [Candidatus Methanohalarchaeum thermophilum]
MDEETVIETKGLTKYYGDVKGAEDLDLSVESGEIFGFLGPNGAGKTTTIRLLLGFLKPSRGKAWLLGRDIGDRKQLTFVKEKIGFLPSEYKFYEDVTGRKMLNHFESIRGGERRDELEEMFPIPFDDKIRNYSHGNKQKLAIIQTFMHNPELVLMDEPTQGLDPLMQREFNEFLFEEKEKGLSVFFSSHILSEVRKVCDRVGIIKNGEIVAVEDVEDLIDKSGKIVEVETKDKISSLEFGETGFEVINKDPLRIIVGKTLEVQTGSKIGRDQFEEKGFKVLNRDPLRIMATGNYNFLLDELSKSDIEDIEIREPSLEDIFMHFYEEE